MINTAEPYCKREAADEQSQQTGSEELTWFRAIVSYHIHSFLTVLLCHENKVLINTLKTFLDCRDIIFTCSFYLKKMGDDAG